MTAEECEYIINYFSQYLEGLLEEDARAVFEEHLNKCSRCRKFLEAQRRLSRLLKAIRFDLPGAPAIQNLPPSAVNSELSDAELDKAAGGIIPDVPVCHVCGSQFCGGKCL